MVDKKSKKISEKNLNEKLLIKEAIKRGIKVSKPIENNRIFSFNGKNHVINAQQIGEMGRVPIRIIQNKEACKSFLAFYGIPIPKGKTFNKDQIKKALKLFKNIKKKLIIRSNNTSKENLIYPNINHEDEFREAFENIAKGKDKVLIEEFFPGKEYQIFATEKGFITAIDKKNKIIEEIHPSIKKLAFKLIIEIFPGIKYVSISIISKKSSLSKPHSSKDYSIFGIEHLPELGPFHRPTEGNPKNIAGAILDIIFPETQKPILN